MFGKECRRMPQLWSCVLVCIGLAPWQSVWIPSSQRLGCCFRALRFGDCFKPQSNAVIFFLKPWPKRMVAILMESPVCCLSPMMEGLSIPAPPKAAQMGTSGAAPLPTSSRTGDTPSVPSRTVSSSQRVCDSGVGIEEGAELTGTDCLTNSSSLEGLKAVLWMEGCLMTEYLCALGIFGGCYKYSLWVLFTVLWADLRMGVPGHGGALAQRMLVFGFARVNCFKQCPY